MDLIGALQAEFPRGVTPWLLFLFFLVENSFHYLSLILNHYGLAVEIFFLQIINWFKTEFCDGYSFIALFNSLGYFKIFAAK